MFVTNPSLAFTFGRIFSEPSRYNWISAQAVSVVYDSTVQSLSRKVVNKLIPEKQINVEKGYGVALAELQEDIVHKTSCYQLVADHTKSSLNGNIYKYTNTDFNTQLLAINHRSSHVTYSKGWEMFWCNHDKNMIPGRSKTNKVIEQNKRHSCNISKVICEMYSCNNGKIMPRASCSMNIIQRTFYKNYCPWTLMSDVLLWMSCYVQKRYIHCSCNLAKKCLDMPGNEDNHTIITAKQKPPWQILFFGTDNIALTTLQELYHNMTSCGGQLVESLDVVTGKERHGVRPVRKFSEEVNLQIYDWPFCPVVPKYDVGILVSFGHLIPDALIQMFPYGILNMHPSLLPRWRGASPVIHSVINGDDITGVSLMKLRPKHFDVGPLLLQRQLQVPHRCTSLQLADILAKIGANMVLECLQNLPALARLENEQNRNGISYAHKISLKNSYVNWDKQTAWEVDCHYRGIHEIIHLRTKWHDHPVQLIDIVDPEVLQDIDWRYVRGCQGELFLASPGTTAFHKQLDCILIKCKDGIVGFKNLILQKKITGRDFYNGYIQKNAGLQFTSVDNELKRYRDIKKISVIGEI